MREQPRPQGSADNVDHLGWSRSERRRLFCEMVRGEFRRCRPLSRRRQCGLRRYAARLGFGPVEAQAMIAEVLDEHRRATLSVVPAHVCPRRAEVADPTWGLIAAVLLGIVAFQLGLRVWW